MANKAGKVLSLAKSGVEAVDRVFAQVVAWAAELSPVVRGQVTDNISLTTGDNVLKVPVKNPSGRLTVYLSAAVTIYDNGQDATAGTWTINASGPATARFLFF